MALSQATRDKMSASAKARTDRTPLSEEHRAKLSAASLGRPKSLQHREAMSLTRKGKPASPAVLQSLMKARASITPESVAKQAASMSRTMKGRERSPAQVEAFAKANQIRLANLVNKLSDGPTVFGLWAVFGEFLHDQDGDLCQLCLQPIDFTLPIRTPWSRSVDHVVPVRGGGSNLLDNLWLAHLVCNQSKGARHIGRADGSTDVRKDPTWT